MDNRHIVGGALLGITAGEVLLIISSVYLIRASKNNKISQRLQKEITARNKFGSRGVSPYYKTKSRLINVKPAEARNIIVDENLENERRSENDGLFTIIIGNGQIEWIGGAKRNQNTRQYLLERI